MVNSRPPSFSTLSIRQLKPFWLFLTHFWFLKDKKQNSHCCVVKMAQQKQKIHMNPELRLLDLVRAVKTLLWVDDALSAENQIIVSMAEGLGVRVELATSTVEALERFEALGETKHFPQSHLRIISDMTRVEDGRVNEQAGLDFAQELRKRKYLGTAILALTQLWRKYTPPYHSLSLVI
jgi:CheY-like chemotaxis protein